MICEFIDAQKDLSGSCRSAARFSAHGVKIAPRTYWAPAARATLQAGGGPGCPADRDPGRDLRAPTSRGLRTPESLYGSLKMWEHLNRKAFRSPGRSHSMPRSSFLARRKLTVWVITMPTRTAG